MRFSRISITSKTVSLSREEKDGKTNAVEEIVLKSPERPMASFDDAVQGFKAYVTGLLPFKVAPDKLTITTLNLSESKDGRRGLQVSCNVPIPKCDEKVISLTTPLVHEEGEESSGESFTLSDEVMELIALAEAEAAAYVDGSRMQLTLPLSKPSENAQEFDEAAAHASSATTRKPRGKNRGASATQPAVVQ